MAAESAASSNENDGIKSSPGINVPKRVVAAGACAYGGEMRGALAGGPAHHGRYMRAKRMICRPAYVHRNIGKHL